MQALRKEQEEATPGEARGLTWPRRGHLQCLLHMGQHHGLMAQVDGWALDCPGGT